MLPEINYWAVLLATLSSMIVGSVWYTPKVVGTYRMKKSGVTNHRRVAARVERTARNRA